MAKYKIWNKEENIIKPSGRICTPEQMNEECPMCGIEGVRMIISTSRINGAVFMEFETTVDTYAKMGCDFSACKTEQDYLDAIEAFEDERNSATTDTVSDATRTADALEDLVLLQELAMDM